MLDQYFTIADGLFYKVAVALLAVASVRAAVLWIRKPRYPPGPIRLPIVGNVLDIPKGEPWVAYSDWSKKYDSDIVYANVLGTPIVVLNSHQACLDLLEKKSGIYSDRLHLTVITKLMSWGNAITLARYGDLWRRYRKLFAQVMKKDSLKNFIPSQEGGVTWYLETLLENPDDFMKNFRFFVGKNVIWNLYGVKVSGYDDPILRTAEEMLERTLYAGLPGNFMADFFPALIHLPEWLPGMGFMEWARQGEELTKEMLNVPFDITRSDMKKGDYHKSLTAVGLEKGEEESVVKWLSASTFTAAVDTTVSTIYVFYLAMAHYPQYQKRAQAEIDAFCGPGRLPTVDDRDSLPYVRSLVKEIMRWQPVAPLSLPHRLTEDDVYKGYFLPSGSIVMSNIWAVSRDPKVFNEPERFDRERYLPAEGKKLPLDPSHFAFGYGRRICVGMSYAENIVFVAIARILATFNVAPVLDEEGNEMLPELRFSLSRVVREPEPFQCSIKPRSSTARALILSNQKDGSEFSYEL